MKKLFKVVLVLLLLSNLPALAKSSVVYDNLELAFGKDLNMVMAIVHDEKLLDLSSNPQLDLKIDASNLLVSKDGDRSFKVDLFLVKADGSREFISSQNTTLKKNTDNKDKNLTLSINSQALSNGVNNLQFDVFDTEASHINTYNLELTAFNKPDKQIDPSEEGAPQTIPSKAQCTDDAFGDCQLDYFFRKVSFEATPQKQAATKIVKDNGKYKILIPFTSGTVIKKRMISTQDVNGNTVIVGPQGPQGETGPQGVQGIQGPKGTDGISGPTGLQGIQGIAGPVGPQGPAGDISTVNNGSFVNVAIENGLFSDTRLNGNILIPDGAALGYVLSSDALGNAAWTDLQSLASNGDNLGNHIAIQDLDMNSNNIINALSISATTFSGSLSGNASSATLATFATNTDNATTANVADLATLATFATNTDNATTANVADLATLATFATNTDNATTANAADYAVTAGSALTATTAASASIADLATFATNTDNATTANAADYAVTAGSALTATTAGSASTADLATFATNTENATTANVADYAITAGSALTATSAGSAITASFATNTDNATTANIADLATLATFATNTENATTANAADYAVTAGSALTATTAGSASIADLATFATNTDNATTANAADYATSAGSATSASTAISALNFTGTLSGDVTGTQSGTTIANSVITGKKLLGNFNPLAGTVSNQDTLYQVFQKLTGNINTNTSNIATNTSNIATNTSNIATNTSNIATNSSNITTLQNTVNAATSVNTASTIVKRDASGNFSAGTITANLTGNVTGNVTGSAGSATTATTATTAKSLMNGANGLTLTGGRSITLNATAITNVTLPSAGTLATTTGLTPIAINLTAINTDGITTFSASGLNLVKVTEVDSSNPAETITTITGGVAGQRLTILTVEGGAATQVKFIDDATNTANTINLKGTADITTDKFDTLELIYDGTKWYEVGNMAN